MKRKRRVGKPTRLSKVCGNAEAGLYELTVHAVELIQKGTPKERITGCAFYHHQDTEKRDKGSDFCIGFGQMESEKFGVICEALAAHGVQYEWNGDPNRRVLIKAGGWR